MASTHRAPKQWCLGKSETVNSFEHWRQNLLYTLTLDTNFSHFLEDGFTWEKKTKANPLRGLQDIPGDTDHTHPKSTAQQQASLLELMDKSPTIAQLFPGIPSSRPQRR